MTLRPRAQGERSAVGHRIEGVDEEVHEHHHEVVLDQVERRQLGSDADVERHLAGPRIVPDHPERVLDRDVDDHGRRLVSPPPRELAHLAERPIDPAHLPAQHAHRRAHLPEVRLHLEQLELARHRRERVADVVRDAGGEHPERRELLLVADVGLELHQLAGARLRRRVHLPVRGRERFVVGAPRPPRTVDRDRPDEHRRADAAVEVEHEELLRGQPSAHPYALDGFIAGEEEQQERRADRRGLEPEPEPVAPGGDVGRSRGDGHGSRESTVTEARRPTQREPRPAGSGVAQTVRVARKACAAPRETFSGLTTIGVRDSHT